MARVGVAARARRASTLGTGVSAPRRFSQAISEGDGISLLAEVRSAGEAEDADEPAPRRSSSEVP